MEQNFSYTHEINNLGFAYIGNVAQSAKTMKSYQHGTMTYCIYFAPCYNGWTYQQGISH